MFESYWAGIETLHPNSLGKLSFDHSGKAQMFQIDLTNEDFKQVRLVLLPASKRVPGDNVKIYANYGFGN